MKPTKKQSNNKDSNKNRKQISEDTSTSKINSYFKTTSKSFNIEPKNSHAPCSSKDFYVQILKERLREISNGTDDGTKDLGQVGGTEDFVQVDGACAVVNKQGEPVKYVLEEGPINPGGDDSKVACSECERNKKESTEWEEKYKELKKLYVKLAVQYSELDLKHKDLVNTATGKSNENNSDANATPVDGDIFTPNELKFLKCMPLDKKKDSTFVLQCLQFGYKNEQSVLVNKSLKGTRDWIEITADGDLHHDAKQPLSPHKVDRMKQLFIERISKCKINSVEYGQRVKDTYINKLIASGIKNISKKQH